MYYSVIRSIAMVLLLWGCAKCGPGAIYGPLDGFMGPAITILH